ncbi:radical SAM protein, partial [Candidatus Sumerlaeota bacterium]|nr:radical SAM protein [Candidatus Sumerlaeota bacterium]
MAGDSQERCEVALTECGLRPDTEETAVLSLDWIEGFVASIRPYVFVRREDSLLILLPNQAYKINRTALNILEQLLGGARIGEVVARHQLDRFDRCRQVHEFFCDVRALVTGCLGDGRGRRAVERIPFERPFNTLPVLSEVAVTYRCNLRCRFCYVGCGCRAGGDEHGEMTTTEVRRVLDIIRHDAQAPSVSFTGGEPMLRDDLPELIAHARALGMRVNLITNGTLLDRGAVERLVEAGLNSAQVSLEGPTADVHDRLTGVTGSFERTIGGIAALREGDVHVHTNTTLNAVNRDVADQMPALAASLGLERLSMNLMIPTRAAIATGGECIGVAYSEAGEIILRIKAAARAARVRFLWYSPTPLCLFNPIANGLGNKGCAACDGLLSVSPTGDVLPCSSFDAGVGNLLREPFRAIWFGDRADYYKQKRYAHRVCRGCADFVCCDGACPLYWETQGYDELLSIQDGRFSH